MTVNVDDVTPFKIEGITIYYTTKYTWVPLSSMPLLAHNQHPYEWTVAKLFAIYKKGFNLDPANYRGISIVVALAKIYDGIPNCRFTL